MQPSRRINFPIFTFYMLQKDHEQGRLSQKWNSNYRWQDQCSHCVVTQGPMVGFMLFYHNLEFCNNFIFKLVFLYIMSDGTSMFIEKLFMTYVLQSLAYSIWNVPWAQISSGLRIHGNSAKLKGYRLLGPHRIKMQGFFFEVSTLHLLLIKQGHWQSQEVMLSI